jgi:methyl-accepting chemotaxis protein
LPDFPQDLLHAAQKEIRRSKGDPEFSLHAAKREWFCRLVNIRNADQQTIGYLLVARDWTGMSEDLRSQMIGSMVSAAALVLVIIAIIPLAVRRYVSRPLADLSEKVVRFSREDEPQRGTGGDELQFLTEEFRRLDERLRRALVHFRRNRLTLSVTDLRRIADSRLRKASGSIPTASQAFSNESPCAERSLPRVIIQRWTSRKRLRRSGVARFKSLR